MNRLFSRFLLAGIGVVAIVVAQPVHADSADLFHDRFQVWVSGVVVDGQVRYLRRGGEIYVPTDCNVSYQVIVEATPLAQAWDFTYEPVLAGMALIPGGFSYARPCESEATSTTVTATNETLEGFADLAGIIFGEQPRITSFLDLGTSSETPAANGIIGPLEVFCDETFEGTLLATPSDRTWTYEYDNTSTGVSTTPEGMITINYSCNNPATTLSVDAQANSDGLVTNPVTVLFDVNTNTPSGPTILGLDYNFDEQVNNNMLPTGDALELEVPYFCSNISRDAIIVSDDPDNTTYTVVQGESNAAISSVNPNRLRLFADPNIYSGCNVPPTIDSNGNVETDPINNLLLGGLENTVVIEATNPSGTTTFSVNTRGYSPMISHVYVEPAQTSGGSERDPYVARFDSNKFSEMINLSYDRIPGQPHHMTLKPVISHDDVALMRPTRNYVFEHNNQPFWMSLDMFDGIIDASPTASEAGPVFPRPNYTIKVGSTSGPDVYSLRLTVTDD